MSDCKQLSSVSLMLLTAVLSSGANATSVGYAHDQYHAGAGQQANGKANSGMRVRHGWRDEEPSALDVARAHRSHGDSEGRRYVVDRVWGGEGFRYEMDHEWGGETSHQDMGHHFGNHDSSHDWDGDHDGWGDGRTGRHGEFWKKRFCKDDPTVVPLPAAAWLFLSGLLGTLGVSRRRRSSQV